MKRLLAGRMAAVLMTVAALFATGGTAASAQVVTVGNLHGAIVMRSITTASSVQPDFTCLGRTVCLFPNNNFTGNWPDWSGPAELATDVWNGQWYSFSQAGASNPNPGSLDDNSNSVMWVYAKDLNRSSQNPQCLTPGMYFLGHIYGYFFIQFGVTSCAADPPGTLP